VRSCSLKLVSCAIVSGLIGLISSPVAAQPAAAPTSDYTGFHVSLGGGYGTWNADTTTVSAATGICNLCSVQTQGGQGGFLTMGLGYDRQFTDRLVLGLFGDVDISHAEGTVQDQDPFFAGRISQTMSFAIGGRVGWLVDPSTLPFVTFGYTHTQFGSANMIDTTNQTATAFKTPAFSRDGWFIGAGAEARVAPDWFVRGEYRYADYGTVTLSDTASGQPPQSSISFHPDAQTFRVAVVYKFYRLGGMPAATPFEDAAPPADGQNDNFDGFHVSAGAGYGMWSADSKTLNQATGACVLCTVQTQGGSGPFGTVGFGYDHRLGSSRFVGGAFVDLDISHIEGTIQDQGPFYAGHESQDLAVFTGARLGWLIGPSTLPFLSAGFSHANFGHATMSDTHNGTISGLSTPAFQRDGWFIGVGAETKIASNWYAKAEYRYADYGTATLKDTGTAIGAIPGATAASSISFHPVTQTFRVAVVYRFNFLNP